MNNHEVEAAIAKMIRERSIAVEKLTERQMGDVILQAIKAGDFMVHVATDPDRQAVTYLPYRDVEALKARIRELEEELDCFRDETAGSDL